MQNGALQHRFGLFLHRGTIGRGRLAEGSTESARESGRIVKAAPIGHFGHSQRCVVKQTPPVLQSNACHILLRGDTGEGLHAPVQLTAGDTHLGRQFLHTDFLAPGHSIDQPHKDDFFNPSMMA